MTVSNSRARWGKILLALGVLSLIVAAASAFYAYVWAKEVTSLEQRPDQVQAGTVAVQMNKDETRAVWAPKDQAGQVTCKATGPDGKSIDQAVGEEMTVNIQDREYQRIGRLTALEAGSQTVTCEGKSDGVFVGKDIGSREAGYGITATIVTIVTSIGGLVLAAIGILMWVTGRRRR